MNRLKVEPSGLFRRKPLRAYIIAELPRCQIRAGFCSTTAFRPWRFAARRNGRGHAKCVVYGTALTLPTTPTNTVVVEYFADVRRYEKEAV